MPRRTYDPILAPQYKDIINLLLKPAFGLCKVKQITTGMLQEVSTDRLN